MADRLATVEHKLLDALRQGGLFGRDAILVVAVSGGPDSVALLHGLLRLRGPARVDLHVAHLNHDFRGEEAEEGRPVRVPPGRLPGAALDGGQG